MTDIGKVLLVNKYFYRKGGAEGAFLETADLLEQHGHAVSFFSMANPRNPPSRFAQYFVPEVDYDTTAPLEMLRASGRLLYSRP